MIEKAKDVASQFLEGVKEGYKNQEEIRKNETFEDYVSSSLTAVVDGVTSPVRILFNLFR